MNEHLRILLQHLPIIGMILERQTAGLVRDLIGAAIIGGIMLYGTVNVLDSRLNDLRGEVHQVIVLQQRNEIRLETLDRRVTRTEVKISDLQRGRHE